MGQTLSEWVDAVDVGGDGVKDSPEYDAIKRRLLQDGQNLHSRFREGKIAKDEYDRHMLKLKSILEKHYATTADVYSRYEQERKVIFLETENKVGGLLKSIRNWKTKVSVEFEQVTSKEDLIQGYTNAGGNYNIRVSDFEKKLQTDDYNTLNSKELASYFSYLDEKKILNKETIESKFGKNMLGFMKAWSNKFQNSYHGTDKDIRKNNELAISTQVMNTLFGKEKKIEKVLDAILKEKLIGTQSITKAVNIYENSHKKSGLFKKTEKASSENENQYTKLIEGAYKVLGNNGNKQEFQKKFEGLLKDGFSTYDAVFEMFGTDVNIKAFQVLMLEVEKIEEKKSQTIGNEIQLHIEKKSCYGENFCRLPLENQLTLATENKDTQLISLLQKQQKSKEDRVYAKTVANSPVAATIALNTAKNNKDKSNKLSNISESLKSTIRLNSSIASFTEKDTSLLRTIPGLENISDTSKLLGDSTLVKNAISGLSLKKEKTQDEARLLHRLEEYFKLATEQKKDLVKAVRNINDEQYLALEKTGQIGEGFASDFIGNISSNSTLASLDQKITEKMQQRTAIAANKEGIEGGEKTSPKNNFSLSGDFSQLHLLQSVNALKVGEKSEAITVGGDTIFIKKTGGGFDVQTKLHTIPCNNTSEVTNYIDSRVFLSDIGCNFMMSGMDEILVAIYEKNAQKIQPFDMKKGFSSEQQMCIMKTLIQSLDLPISHAGSSVTELKERFKSHFFTSMSSNPIRETIMRKRHGIITNDGSFHTRAMISMLQSEFA